MIYTQAVPKNNGLQDVILRCECHDLDHRVEFSWDDDDDTGCVTVTLVQQSFWRRLRVALRYLFKRESPSGWTEVLFSARDAEELCNWLRERSGA